MCVLICICMFSEPCFVCMRAFMMRSVIHICVYTYSYVYVLIHICMFFEPCFVCMRVFFDLCYIHICDYIYSDIYVCIQLYIYAYSYIFVCFHSLVMVFFGGLFWDTSDLSLYDEACDIYIYIYKYTYMFIYVYTYMCKNTHSHTHMYTNIYIISLLRCFSCVCGSFWFVFGSLLRCNWFPALCRGPLLFFVRLFSCVCMFSFFVDDPWV